MRIPMDSVTPCIYIYDLFLWLHCMGEGEPPPRTSRMNSCAQRPCRECTGLTPARHIGKYLCSILPCGRGVSSVSKPDRMVIAASRVAY